MEPSKLCLDHPELSLRLEQGIFMWSAVAALWRYTCEVRYGRTEPMKEGFAAFWMSQLSHWGRGEPVRISPRSAQRVRQAIDPPQARVHNKANAGGGPGPPAQKRQEVRPAGAQGTAQTQGPRGARPGGRPPAGGPESVDRRIAAEGGRWQTVCRIWSMVWGEARPEPLRGAARSTPDQQQGRTASMYTCTKGNAAARTPGTVRGFTAGHGRGDTVAARVDQEEMENEARVSGRQHRPVDGDAEPIARPQGPNEVGQGPIAHRTVRK